MDRDQDAAVHLASHPGAAAPGAAPRRLGRYIIEDVIARGGMGVVYRARQEDLGRLVALKVMLQGADADPEDRQRFAQEVRAVARLTHPGIVQVYEVGQEGERPYFAMELIQGQSLSAILERERITLERALRLMEPICAAIEHAHREGIVHRDLKPANILVRPGDIPVVTDFGLARDLGSTVQLTATGTAMGTPAYMAPEQARGDRQAMGPATDVYALGALLYELLTLQPPFQGATPGVIISKVLHEEPRPPRKLVPSLPREAEWICQRAMAKSPAERYPSAAALGEDLERLRTGRSVQAGAPSLLRRGGKWIARNRAVFALGLALAIVAAGGSALWLWQSWRLRRARGADFARALEQAREALEDRPAQAVAQANLALFLAPGDPAALRLRGTAYARIAGFEEAAATDLEAHLRQVPAAERERCLLARLYVAAGRHAAALKILAPLAHRREAEVLLLTAEARLGLGQVEVAEALLDGGRDLWRTPIDRCTEAMLRAAIIARSGRRRAAFVQSLRASDVFDPQRPGGQVPRGKDEFQTALRAHLLAATSARDLGQNPDGEDLHALADQQRLALRALGLAPGQVEALYLHAEATTEIEGERSGPPLWQKLLSVAPDDPRPYFQLARFHLIKILATMRDDDLGEALFRRELEAAGQRIEELRARAPSHPLLPQLAFLAAFLAGQRTDPPSQPDRQGGGSGARLSRYRDELLALTAQQLPTAHMDPAGATVFQVGQTAIRDNLLRAVIETPGDSECWQSAYFTMTRIPQTPGRGRPFSEFAQRVLLAIAIPSESQAERLFPNLDALADPALQPLFSAAELAEIAMLSGHGLRADANTRYLAARFFQKAAEFDASTIPYAYQERLALHFAEFSPEVLVDASVLLRHHPASFEMILERVTSYRDEVGDLYKAVISRQREKLADHLRGQEGGEVIERAMEVFLDFVDGRYAQVLERMAVFEAMVGADSPLPPTLEAYALLKLERETDVSRGPVPRLGAGSKPPVEVSTEARSALARALEQPRALGFAWALRAALHGRQGEWEQAFAAFDQAVARDFQAERLFRHDPLFESLRRHEPFAERFEIKRIRERARTQIDRRTEAYWRERLAERVRGAR